MRVNLSQALQTITSDIEQIRIVDEALCNDVVHPQAAQS
jgi:hypothetical protein